MRQIILKIKYDNKREYLEGFAKLMSIKYRDLINKSEIDCIIPVPLHKSRQRERGFNQSDILAKHLSKYLNIPSFPDYLGRIKKTKDQKGLNKDERRHNLDNAFIAKDIPVYIKNVLIVDDVYTTGTTIEKCAIALKKAGVKNIYFLTVCTGETNL